MNYSTHCKFCKRPITIEIDDSYAELGDHLKLLPMASCNLCADLMVVRRVIEERVKRCCLGLAQMRGKVSPDFSQKTRASLVKLTHGYATMISKWNRMSGMAWDEECVNLLMEKPDKWNLILSELWKLFKDSQSSHA